MLAVPLAAGLVWLTRVAVRDQFDISGSRECPWQPATVRAQHVRDTLAMAPPPTAPVTRRGKTYPHEFRNRDGLPLTVPGRPMYEFPVLPQDTPVWGTGQFDAPGKIRVVSDFRGDRSRLDVVYLSPKARASPDGSDAFLMAPYCAATGKRKRPAKDEKPALPSPPASVDLPPSRDGGKVKKSRHKKRGKRVGSGGPSQA